MYVVEKLRTCITILCSRPIVVYSIESTGLIPACRLSEHLGGS
jgi:hypothetical protein